MPFQQYKQNNQRFNINFLEAAGSGGLSGYRGELVLVEGRVADAKGHAKPPVEVMPAPALLADEKLKPVLGLIAVPAISDFTVCGGAELHPTVRMRRRLGLCPTKSVAEQVISASQDTRRAA